MNTHPNITPVRCRSAFSLVEVIIAVGLMTFIMLGLLAMFDQTQRAFRTSMTQTDVLESGRAVAAMLAGELEQITPSRWSTNTVNFFMTNYASAAQPAVQLPLPGANSAARTNVMEGVFFLSRYNQQWIGTGYMMAAPAAGFGTLYHFTTNYPLRQDPQWLMDRYQEAFTLLINNQPLPATLSRLADGVVHFRVRIYDTNSFPITNNLGNLVANLPVTNIVVDAPALDYLGGEARSYFFVDQAVPVSVEFELGILEDRALARLRAIPDATFQRRQLTNQVGSMHLFRQKVTVRDVDLTAYQ